MFEYGMPERQSFGCPRRHQGPPGHHQGSPGHHHGEEGPHGHGHHGGRRHGHPFGGRGFGRPEGFGNLMEGVLQTVQAMEPLFSAIEKSTGENGYKSRDISFDKKNNMTVAFSTKGYLPSDLKVDVEDGYLKIAGIHKEELEGEIRENTFSRQIKLPENVDLTNINCNVDEDGKLVVKVPQIPSVEAKKTIPIEVRLAKAKENKETGKAAEKNADDDILSVESVEGELIDVD